LSIDWQAANEITRKTTDLDRSIVQQAFRLSRPTADSSRYGGVVLASGDYAVIRLNKVTDGDPAAVDAAARETLKRRLASDQGVNAQLRLVSALRAKAKIVVNNNEL